MLEPTSQPKFPTYHGPPLPAVLNPLNPRHYGLLLMWVFFQPSRLKHYLYRADPDLYRQTGRAIFKTIHLPAYRSLYLMALILTPLLTSCIVWAVSAILGTPPEWERMALGVVLGVALGVVVGVAVGVAVGAVLVVAFGVAVGVAVGVVSGVAFGVVLGVAVSVAVGVAFVVALGGTLGVAFGVTFGVTLGVMLGVVFGAPFGVASVVASIVGGFMGGSRAVFHLFEWPLAHGGGGAPFKRLARHPAWWDELAIWPLPGPDRLLQAALATDLAQGGRETVQVAANPCQRWAAQRALADFLVDQPYPLAELYTLAHLPILDEYLVVPAGHGHFRRYPSARLVLLGELGQTFVDGTGGLSETSERLIWWLTRRLRRMQPTPLAQFSAMLYALFRDQEQLATIDMAEIKLSERFAANYEAIRYLPNGEEVADSFVCIAKFLEANTITDLAQAKDLTGLRNLSGLVTPLRPTVIETLKALGDVSLEVATFERATNTRQQAAALNRAAGLLNELAGYVAKEVLPPERVLLARVVEHWQSIVAKEQGKLGEAALREISPAARRAAGVVERQSAVWQRPATPFDNPYVVGDPVYPPLFVGRKDVFDRISEVWSAKANPDSIILYGHRRMGKSSILRNLDQVAPEGSLIVYADMAGETSFVESTADLLLGLADRLYAALRRQYPEVHLTEPGVETYDTPAKAQREFSRFAERVRESLAGQTIILALDEFEAIEQAVAEGKIGQEIFRFLRAKTQEPWLTLVFGGLHTLDEMSRDYQQPFYGSYENILVSYLAHEAAWRLITNPAEDFELNYEYEAVERIIAVTGGQPYLVQQICRDALDHLNHELFDLERERAVLITLADVEAVLHDDFFRRGMVYFDGVWTQASQAEQRTLLRAVAQRDEPWTLTELAATTGLEPNTLRRELRWAERHDILHKSGDESPAWQFYVPLMRQWIRQRSS